MRVPIVFMGHEAGRLAYGMTPEQVDHVNERSREECRRLGIKVQSNEGGCMIEPMKKLKISTVVKENGKSVGVQFLEVVEETEALRYSHDASEDLRSRNSDLQFQCGDLHNRLFVAESNIVSLSAQKHDLEIENDKLRTSCGELRAENESLRRKLEILQKPVYFSEPPYIDDPLHAKNLRRDVDRHARLGERLEKKVSSLDARFAAKFAANPNELLRGEVKGLEHSLICANKRINELENELRNLLFCDLPKRVAKLEAK